MQNLTSRFFLYPKSIGASTRLVFHSVMRTLTLSILSILFIPVPAFASPVINEVMWMGSDISTADEWLEIFNPDSVDIDLSGWSVTSVNSSGKEVVSFRFQTGSVIAAGEYLVIASKAATASRIFHEPYAVSSVLSLPNTKLLLRLRDAESQIVDEVDDGVGSPFAGANPSGGEGKASMQRLDAHALGNLKDNWTTSSVSIGFDAGVAIFGTPGFSSDTDTDSDPEEEPDDPAPDPPETPGCSDPLQIAIAVQSGPLVAVGKATVNFQAVATEGSLSGVECRWSYGDGFSSTSCNPPVHSFVGAGTYRVILEAKNQCDITLQQEQVVQVLPDAASPTSSSAQPTWYDGSRLVMIGALPNPPGTDTSKEWIEIKNLEEKPVDLRGWKLAVGETSIRSFPLKDSIGPRSTLRLYNSELQFSLPNTTSKVQLIPPNGVAISTIVWKSADEDRTYFPDDIRALSVRCRVLRVTGPVTFLCELDGDAAAALGRETVTVRIPNIGIDSAMTIKEDPIEYLGALIEGKNIELQFSTDIWDDLGRLMADAIIDDRMLLRDQLLLSKIWIQFGALDNNKKEELMMINNDIADSYNLSISEVYPSPFPAPKGVIDRDWKNAEWLELENHEQFSVDLSGWKVVTKNSEKNLTEGLKVSSGSRIILYTSTIGLSLRNAGDNVRLVSPQGSVVSSVEYPVIKNGTSFAVDRTGSCITIEPTPGLDNSCVKPVVRTRSAIAKSVAAKKSTAKVKAFAASYRAQADSETDDQQLVVLQDEPTSTSWFSLAFAACMGVAVSMIFGLIMASHGVLDRMKNRNKILNK